MGSNLASQWQRAPRFNLKTTRHPIALIMRRWVGEDPTYKSFLTLSSLNVYLGWLKFRNKGSGSPLPPPVLALNLVPLPENSSNNCWTNKTCGSFTWTLSPILFSSVFDLLYIRLVFKIGHLRWCGHHALSCWSFWNFKIENYVGPGLIVKWHWP